MNAAGRQAAADHRNFTCEYSNNENSPWVVSSEEHGHAEAVRTAHTCGAVVRPLRENQMTKIGRAHV